MWAISWLLLIKYVWATSPMITSPRPSHHAEPLPHGSTIFIEPWEETAFSQGGSLIVKIDTKDDICDQTIDLVKISIKTVNSFEKVINMNLLQIEKISFSTFRMEQSIEILINLINKLIDCENNMKDLIVIYKKLKNELNEFWKKPELNKNIYFQNLSSNRTNMLIQTANIPTVIAGVGAGLLLGGVIGNLISGKLDKWSLNNLNEKINKNGKNIMITNERIEIMEKNITDIFQNIKKIFIEIETEKEQKNIVEHLIFNLKNIEDTSNNYINLLKIKQNKLTLLRNGLINPEIININQFKKVIEEGENSFNNLIFPIQEISKRTILNIIKLIEIREVKTNEFIAIIPLVRNQRYEINTILPLPIQISTTQFLKIKIKNVMLISSDQKFIISEDRNLEKIDDGTFLMKKVEPVWINTTKRCEIAAYKRDTKNVMDICYFEKLESKDEIYLSETKTKRIIFAIKPEEITLDCPGGKIIKTLTGLYTIPFKCNIQTEIFIWPAKSSKEIKISNLIELNDRFPDITKLKIFEINDTNIINKKIKDLIDELPEENEKLTIDFEDFSLENFKPISVIGFGIITALSLITSIVIIILYVKRKKEKLGDKEWKNRWNDRLHRSRNKFRNARNSIRNSVRNSFRNSFNRNKERVRLRGQEFFRNNVRDAGTNTEISNTTENPDRYKKDVFVDVY